MKIAKGLALLAFLAMTVVLVFAFTKGNFFEEGAKLLAMPWGIVSMVDLYSGFTLFSIWIVFREKSIPLSIFWVILVMLMGFWAGALYTLLAFHASSGNWDVFWYGKRKKTIG